MNREVDDCFSVFAFLTALCCLTHFATHLGPANFQKPSWWLAAGIILCAIAVLQRITLARFLLLIGLQAMHVLVDAPFNPDHWRLQFFVNFAILLAALRLWLQTGRISAGELYDQFAPSARLIFLICYGCAAFCKYNTHFLNPATSCATEFTYIQIQVSPWLAYMTWPPAAGWLTALCESAIPLALIWGGTRKFGIMLALVFHTALVISPAIAVFDFTVTVYTMAFLFAPPSIGTQLRRQMEQFRVQAPAVCQLFNAAKLPILCAAGGFMIGRSGFGYALYGDARVGHVTWIINMMIAVTIIWRAAFALFDREMSASVSQVTYRPRQLGHYVIVALVLLNGLCPYLGLKTQGSFTMFSNLRTEAGHWNHLVVPRAMRLISTYQDELVHVTQIDDRRIQRDFVERNETYLVPLFEVQRAATNNQDMSITVLRDGHEQTLRPASLDPAFGHRPHWLLRKLFIFRPVTMDGSPYCGN